MLCYMISMIEASRKGIISVQVPKITLTTVPEVFGVGVEDVGGGDVEF